MIIRNYLEVEEEPMEVKGGGGIKLRWLVDDDTGKNFAMRRYELAGSIPLHKHSHEHEVYFLEGGGEITDSKGESRQVGPGDFAFIPPNEPHGFKNKSKDTKLVFLCMVPKVRGKPEFLL